MEITIFWIAEITALLASVYAWCRNDWISQTSMLVVYLLLACNMALAVCALASLSDISALDEGRHAAIGLLLGSMLGFSVTAIIAARLSKSFPDSCIWFALAATVMSFVVSKGYLADMPEFGAYTTLTSAVACLIGFCLFSIYRRNFTPNQSLAGISILFIHFFRILLADGTTYSGQFLAATVLALLAVFCLTSGLADNRIKRVLAAVMLVLMMLVVTSRLHNLIPMLPLAICHMPSFLISLVVAVWIKYQRDALPAFFYALSLYLIALFVILGTLPAGWDNDLLASVLVVTVACWLLLGWWYGVGRYRQSSWSVKSVLQYAGTGFCVAAIMVVFVKVVCFPLEILVHAVGPARQLAKLHGTVFWPGDKMFIRLALADEYLWADEAKPLARLKARATADEALDGVIASHDRYSYLLSKEEKDNDDNGITDLAGIHLVMVKGMPVVKYATESSVAAKNGLARGDCILAMNGRMAKDRLEEPSWASIIDKRQPTTLIVKSASGQIRKMIVQKRKTEEDLPFGSLFRTGSGRLVGYLYFNKFQKPQIESLDPIFAWFKKAGIHDLVIDLRYNGGGAARASQLLAGLVIGARHDGDVYIHTEHSWRYHKRDHTVLIEKQKQSLDIRNLAVLTTGETASASEEFIVGLKPYINVITVGRKTYGKPYSMDPITFGDTQLLMITGQMYNAKGETYSSNGIWPDLAVKDDLYHQLGDPGEGMLRAALDTLDNL